MVKTGVQKCGTNWRVILQGEANDIETKHWSFFNHGATKADLEWETETCAHFWSTPEKILKALQKAHLFSLLNRADLVGDEPEAEQFYEISKHAGKAEFEDMETLPNFKPFKTVSVLNLDCFNEGTVSAEKLDSDA
jgi:hypothetical protein